MKARLESYKRIGVLASEMEFSVYCILRDFYVKRRRRRISVGALLTVLASAPGRGAIRVSKAEEVERDMIKIGLDTLLVNDSLKKGKPIDVDFNQVIRKLMVRHRNSRDEILEPEWKN